MRRRIPAALVLAATLWVIAPNLLRAHADISIPGAPLNVSAQAGTLSATVQWTPADSAATSYTVTSSPRGITATVAGTATGATVTGLAFATSYTFTVAGTNGIGTGPSSQASNPVTPQAPGGPYHQGVARVLADTDVTAANPVKFNTGEDRVHAPGLSAVVLNVTASAATQAAAVQVVVQGQVQATVPVAPGLVESSLVVVPVVGQLNPAAVEVSAGQAHVEIDFVGLFTGAGTVGDRAGLLQMIRTTTLLDTSMAAGTSTDLLVVGKGDVPLSGVAGVLLNVTAINPGGPGALSVLQQATADPGTSALGFAGGQTTANRMIVPVSANGTITLLDRGAATEARVDVLGWFSDGTDPDAVGALYTATTPTREVDAVEPAGASVTFPVWGQAGIPGGSAPGPATSALVQIAVSSPAGAGSIVISGTSVVDFGTGQTAVGTAVVPVAMPSGSASLTVLGAATNVTVDVVGFFSGDLIMPGSTKVLTPAQLAGITDLNADSITFAPGAQISPPVMLNDVINAGSSAATPHGLLRRVLSISTTADGSTVLLTRSASVPEALTSFFIDWTLPPKSGAFGMGHSQATRTLAAAAPVSVNPLPPPPGTSIDPNWPSFFLAKPPQGVMLDLSTNNPGLQSGSEIDINDLEDQARINFIAGLTPSGKLQLHIGFGVGVRASIDIQLLAQVTLLDVPHILETFFPIGPPIFIWIGFFIFEFEPGIDASLEFRVSLAGGAILHLGLDHYIELSGGYDGKNFFVDPITNKDYLSPQQEFNWRPSIQLEFELDVHLDPAIAFYGGIGVIEADPVAFARFTVDPTAPHWWDITLGICRSFEFKLNLIFLTADVRTPRVCLTLTALQAPGRLLAITITPSSATVARSGTQHFHANVPLSVNGVLWSIDEAAGGSLSNVTQFDVDYTAPRTAGKYHLRAEAVDDPTSAIEIPITVPAVAPSAPSGVVATVTGPTTVSVLWTAPTDDGGAPITTYYVLVAQGSSIFPVNAPGNFIVPVNAPNTSTSIPALNPGTTYTFGVTAGNQANLVSVPGVSNSITTPAATPVTVQPPSVDFGTVSLNQVSAPQTVTVFATDVRALTISTLTMGGARPQDYTIQSDNCSGQVVPAGGSCTFAVLFTANAQGPSSAFVQINDDDPTSPQSVSLKAQVPAVVVVAACYLNTIAGGDRDTAVVDPTGKVLTWGANQYGQLGNGTTTASAVPVAVSTSTGLPAVSEVSMGFYHTVVRTTSGTVWSWGNNSSGELGNTTVPNGSNVPVQVMDAAGTGFLTGVSDVSAGSFPFTVAVKSADGSVWAWGLNADGELGNGTTTNSPTPVQVKGPGGVGFLTGIVKVQAGNRFAVALKSDGTVWTWGFNSTGELGDGAETAMETTPVQVVGIDGVGLLTGVIAIGSHGFHTVAVRSDGTLVAWGNDPYGQLGDGVAPPTIIGNNGFGIPHPVAVSTLAGLTNRPSVSTGGEHSLAADPTSGTAWAWGSNSYGQIAQQNGSLSTTPLKVVAATNFTEVSAGTWHSVGLGSDGSVWTWGQNLYGQLGNGRIDVGSSFNPSPHVVAGLTAAQPQPCSAGLTTPGVQEMADIQMIDGQHGFAVDSNGILATSNGGSAWFREQMPADAQIPPSTQGTRRPGRVHFVDLTHGWVLACTVGSCAPLVIGTTDGGASWHDVSTLPATLNATEMWWTDPQHGWVVGWIAATKPAGFNFNQASLRINTLYATADGGQTWHLQTLPGPTTAACPLETDEDPGIKFTDAQNGWAAWEALCYQSTSPFTFIGGLGFAWNTNNGGATWVQHPMPAAVFFLNPQRLQVLSPTQMRVLGQFHVSPGIPANAIVTTDDGGATFNVVQLSFNPNDVRFLDATHAIAIDETNGIFYRTADGGQTWLNVANMPSPVPQPNLLRFIQYDLLEFADANNIWMAGGASYPNSDPGLIEKSSDGGATWTVQLMGVGT